MDTFVATKKRVPTKLNTPLAHSFGFDFGDLQDNRSGFISHWQKKRLRWYLLSYTISNFIWILLLTIFPIVLGAGNPFFMRMAILWSALVLTVFGIIWLWQLRSVFLDMSRGKVANLVSTVRHIREIRKSRQGIITVLEHSEMDYFVGIGRERFITSREQMEAFREGLLYNIYVAPESRQILSAEPVSQSEQEHEPDFLHDKTKRLEGMFEPEIQERTVRTRKRRRR